VIAITAGIWMIAIGLMRIFAAFSGPKNSMIAAPAV
jgi:hypothetical protein